MSDRVAPHREAAERHEMAAGNHRRAAAFWDGRGDPDRAQLQREMAQYEQSGAELERRWAKLVEPNGPRSASRAAEFVAGRTRLSAGRLSNILIQSAEALERTAGLADQRAKTCERGGKGRDAANERQAAQRAREFAQHARSEAEKWQKMGESPDQ